MRNKDRQYIPTIPTKKTPSLWQRLRSAASVAVAAVRSAGARIVALVARKATGARASLSRIARAAMVRRPWVLTRDGAQDAASRVTGWCRATWRRVVHPFMRVRVAVLGIGAVVVGLVAAPVATLTTLVGCGAVLLGLSRLIRRLEDTDHPAAHVALRVIETVAQVLRVAAYVAAGAAVLVISATSAVFAVTEVLELVLRYLDVPLAASLAALAFFVLTASWGLAIVEVTWLAMVHEGNAPARASRPRSQDRQIIPLIRIDADRAWNGEEVVSVVPGSAEPLASEEEEIQETMDMIDSEEIPAKARTAKCVGCDLDDGSPRYCVGDMPSLCGGCLEFLVDDELITAAERGEVNASDVVAAVQAGIAVPAYVVITTGARLRNTRIDLDREAITCRTQARSLSEQDPSRVHWAETGWWFDGRGGRRARRWHGFVSGRIAATVEYQYEKSVRGFYFTIGDDHWASRCFKTLTGAQSAAADEISDRRPVIEPQTPAFADALLAGAAS